MLPPGSTSHPVIQGDPLSRNRGLAAIGAALAVATGGSAAVAITQASTQPAQNIVPAQVSILNPPRYFGWNRVMTYRVAVVSPTNGTANVRVNVQTYMKSNPSASRTTQPTRHVQVRPGEPVLLKIRTHTPSSPLVGMYDKWCIVVTATPDHAGDQTAGSCSVWNGVK